MNHSLHSRFPRAWERLDYSEPPSGLPSDQECYVVELRPGRKRNRVVNAAVTPAEGDAMVTAHEKWRKT